MTKRYQLAIMGFVVRKHKNIYANQHKNEFQQAAKRGMEVNMNKENIKKVVLAYSGGLDTSIIIPWLKENYNN